MSEVNLEELKQKLLEKEERLNKLLFKKKTRESLINNQDHYATLSQYLLESAFPNYPWFASYDARTKQFYIFNSAVLPEGDEFFNLLKCEDFNEFFERTIKIGRRILVKAGLPEVADTASLNPLISENRRNLPTIQQELKDLKKTKNNK